MVYVSNVEKGVSGIFDYLGCEYIDSSSGSRVFYWKFLSEGVYDHFYGQQQPDCTIATFNKYSVLQDQKSLYIDDFVMPDKYIYKPKYTPVLQRYTLSHIMHDNDINKYYKHGRIRDEYREPKPARIPRIKIIKHTNTELYAKYKRGELFIKPRENVVTGVTEQGASEYVAPLMCLSNIASFLYKVKNGDSTMFFVALYDLIVSSCLAYDIAYHPKSPIITTLGPLIYIFIRENLRALLDHIKVLFPDKDLLNLGGYSSEDEPPSIHPDSSGVDDITEQAFNDILNNTPIAQLWSYLDGEIASSYSAYGPTTWGDKGKTHYSREDCTGKYNNKKPDNVTPQGFDDINFASVLDDIITSAESVNGAFNRSPNTNLASSVIYLLTFLVSTVHSISCGTVPDLNDLSKYSQKEAMSFGTSGSFATALHITNAMSCVGRYVRNLKDKADVGSSFTDCCDLGTRILSMNSPAAMDFAEQSDFGTLQCDYVRLYNQIKLIRPNLVNRLGCSASEAALLSKIDRNHIKVMEKINSFKNMLNNAGLRHAPYSILLYGGSSVGKSSVTTFLNQYILQLMGLPTDPKYIYAHSPGHKHMDGYEGWKLCINLDDIGAQRKDSLPEGDTLCTNLGRFINNAAYMTPQAEISAKNSTPFLAKVLIGNTNTKTLRAGDYFHFPAIIMRRFRCVITVKPRPEYADGLVLDVAKATADAVPGTFPDFWLFDVEYFRITTNSTNVNDERIDGEFKYHKYVSDNGSTILLQNIRIDVLLDFLAQDVPLFVSQQNIVVKPPELLFCNMCNRAKQICRCQSKLHVSYDSDGNVISRLDTIIPQGLTEYYDGIGKVLSNIDPVIVGKVAMGCGVAYTLYNINKNMNKYSNSIVKSMENVRNTTNLANQYMTDIGSHINTVLPVAMDSLNNINQISSDIRPIVADIAPIAQDSLDQVKNYNEFFRQSCIALAAAFSVGGILYVAIRLFYKDNKPKEQGLAESKYTLGTRTVINNTTGARTWAEGQAPMPYNSSNWMSKSSKSTTNLRSVDDVKNRFAPWVVTYRACSTSSGFETMTAHNGCGIILRGGILLTAAHVFRQLDVKQGFHISLCRSPKVSSDNRSPTENIDEPIFPYNGHNQHIIGSCCYNIPNTDFMFIKLNVPFRGAFDPMDPKSTLFPQSKFEASNPFCLVRSRSGVLTYREMNNQVMMKNVEQTTSDGRVLTVPYAIEGSVDSCTDYGDSGCPLFINTGDKFSNPDGQRNYIAFVGTLYGLVDATRRSVFHCLTQSMYEDAHRVLVNQCVGHIDSPELIAARMAALPQCLSEEPFNLKLEDLGPINAKSCVSMYSAKQVSCGILGGTSSTHGLPRSRYEPTVYSPVLERMGNTRVDSVLGDLKNKFMPTLITKQNVNIVHTKTLEAMMSVPGEGIPQDLLDKASASYISDFFSRLEREDDFSYVRPFSIVDAINGIPGIMEGVDMSTGGGYQYEGCKRNYFTRHRALENDPHGFELGVEYYLPCERLWEDIKKLEDQLDNGIIPQPVFTSHIKDEVRTTDKVNEGDIRVMSGSPLPYTIVVRKYLMGIIILMKRYKIASECMVGMNVESRQWDDLIFRMLKVGGLKRHLDGDYKHYDKNIKSNLSYTIGDTMFGILYGCTQRSTKCRDLWGHVNLSKARALCTSMSSAIIDFFGSILNLDGPNTSGQSLTTQFNCVGNSIIMRCVNLKVNPNFAGRYCDHVMQVTYGDDVWMTVDESFDGILTHLSIRDTLHAWGIPYTRADKSDITNEKLYTHFNDSQFLKRHPIYDEEIGAYLPALDIKSIVKSLHYRENTGSLSSPQHHVVMIRGIANNALCHGRVKYEYVVELLTNIMKQSSLCNSAEFKNFIGYSNSNIADGFETYDSFMSRFEENSIGYSYDVDYIRNLDSKNIQHKLHKITLQSHDETWTPDSSSSSDDDDIDEPPHFVRDIMFNYGNSDFEYTIDMVYSISKFASPAMFGLKKFSQLVDDANHLYSYSSENRLKCVLATSYNYAVSSYVTYRYLTPKPTLLQSVDLNYDVRNNILVLHQFDANLANYCFSMPYLPDTTSYNFPGLTACRHHLYSDNSGIKCRDFRVYRSTCIEPNSFYKVLRIVFKEIHDNNNDSSDVISSDDLVYSSCFAVFIRYRYR